MKRGGDEASKFHELCYKIENTITLIKTTEGKKYRGYARKT